MLTNKQLELRRKGITATDISKIVGVSQFGSAIDVQMDKLNDEWGQETPAVETERMKWGNLLEGPIRDDYAIRHQRAVDVPGTLIHPDEPWAMATPDGVVYSFFIPWRHVPVSIETAEKPIRGLEIKTHTAWLSDLYGEPGTDEVPAWELVQCAWNLYVARAYYGADIDRWDLVAFVDGVPTDYVIMHDKGLEDMLITAAREFWARHIVEKQPLSPDGSDSYTAYLKSRFPRHDDQMIRADEESSGLIELLKECRGELKTLSKEEAMLVQSLKERIGDHQGIVFDDADGGGKITWKKAKDSLRTDWKEAFHDLKTWAALRLSVTDMKRSAFDSEVDEIQKRSTRKTEGTRRFCVPRKWSK